MSGLKLVLPTSFTDLTLPTLRDDPVMSSGTLALIDPSHPATAWAAGVPANAATLPNIAHVEAAALLGVADNAALSAVFNTYGSLSGAKGKIERTGKGGLHGIVSQAPGIANGDGAMLGLPAAIRSYMFANKTHKFYVSVWNRTTRVPIANAGTNLEIGSGGNSTRFVFYRSDVGWTYDTSLAADVRNGTPQALGNNFASLGVTPNNTPLTVAPTNAASVWGMPPGSFNAAVSGWVTQLPSRIFYRLYVEDLTASGRAYAEVDALDNAEYTKQVLTAGGRYYGDTFTDPATIP
jgi:hypothetical protein